MASNPPIDGIAAPQSATSSNRSEKTPATQSLKKWKTLLIVAGSILYVCYAFWSFALMATLPAPAGEAQAMVNLGVAVAGIVGVGFLATAGLLLLRISKSGTSLQIRKFALIKLGAVVIPGLLLSIVTPLLILREPSLPIDIVSPVAADQFIAPLAITFDAQRAVNSLKARGMNPIQYKWDINGDKKVDQETLDPTLVSTYESQGVYVISVSIVGSDGSVKTASKRFIINQATIALEPATPVIDKAVVFSLAHLYPDKDLVEAIEWDFDSDGKIDETTKDVRSSYTYLKTGPMKVTATVNLANKTKSQYSRSIEVVEPEKLPFPVTIESVPALLINTSPFTVLFKIKTEEPVANVQWNFGDGEIGEGNEIAHTFRQNGDFAVQARVRSASGVVADLSTLVEIVERLDLPDLRFEGNPVVSGNKIEGQVPLSLNITPVTNKAFVRFQWEAPNATQVGSTDTTLQAVYRREGNYTVTLIAQDAERKVLRLPITVTVLPPESSISFQVSPETGVAPVTVKFDASESTVPGDDITGFIWNFGDNSEEEYGGAFTQHTYQSAGTYVVDLSVTTVAGKQLRASRTIVVRAPALQACILPSRLRGTAPFGVEFEDCSTGDVQSVLWDFGDGSQTDEREPIHVFSTPGTYTVKLKVTSANQLTSTTSVSITVD